VALLIPVAFGLKPDSALIMMTGVYMGAMYGGSLTAILLKVPGEASSVMTSIDGYEMAKQGRGAQALAVSAIGSFVGGTASVIALTVMALPIARFALMLGPAEYFSLIVAAMIFVSVLLGKDLLRGIIGIVFGLAVSSIGMDMQTGVTRLTFGFDALADGIDNVVVIIGIFGVGEVLWFLAHETSKVGERLAIHGRLWLSGDDWRRAWPAMLRGTVIGFLCGLKPGSGATLGSILSYTMEQRLSKEPQRFGRGAIEAVAGPETSNNAATGGAMISMLSLGIPGHATTAVMMVALMMYGIMPGPRLMIDHPDLVWSVIASLYVSNVILLVMNLPLIPLFVKILDIPSQFLMPLILVIAATGAFSMANNFSDVIMAFSFGVIGYLMRMVEIPLVSVALGVVLGEKMEQTLRQALLLSRGDWAIFATRPLSAMFLAAALLVIMWDTISRERRRRAGKAQIVIEEAM
jgi:putative tricarboxylic transport membrane protein